MTVNISCDNDLVTNMFGEVERLMQVSLNMMRALPNLGMTNIFVKSFYNHLTKKFIFSFTDSSLIIADHKRESIQKLFDLDIDHSIESQSMDYLECEEFQESIN